MKKITNKTILKQRDKKYQPVEVDGVDYCIDENVREFEYDWVLYKDLHISKLIWKSDKAPFIGRIIAQSQPKLDGIPVISLDSYIEKLCPCIGLDFRVEWINGYNSNLNQYTQKDIEKVIELARYSNMSEDKTLEQINSISVIEVDEHFNILNYV